MMSDLTNVFLLWCVICFTCVPLYHTDIHNHVMSYLYALYHLRDIYTRLKNRRINTTKASGTVKIAKAQPMKQHPLII